MNEQEKKESFEDFRNMIVQKIFKQFCHDRFEFYVKTFEMAGFSRQQSEKLAEEFCKLINI